MAIRTKLTTADEVRSPTTKPGAGDRGQPPARTEEEKAQRKERVARAKDALARSAGTRGEHVAPARAALKHFLQHLNDARQPSDELFEALLEAPFRQPPKKRMR